MLLHLNRLFIFLTFVIQSSALGTTSLFEKWRELVPAEMQGLPAGVLKWYITETDYLSRAVDTYKIVSPENNSQDEFYKPERKKVFDVVAVWIPEKELRTYTSPSGEKLRSIFFRNRNGQSEFLFLIHPESKSFYKKFLNPTFQVETFQAAATSSSRSLLIWRPGHENQPFIAKLSLNKEIAGVLRNLKGSETAMSVGVSSTLEGSTNFPKNFLYMKESLSAIPKGMEKGGMIVREFPQEMLNDSSYFVPLFALYGNKKPGYLLRLLQNSKDSTEETLRKMILRPFAEVWLDLAMNHGILSEPHAQNVLIEINNDGTTGRFLFRDFGGFSIDFDYRRSRNLFVPSNLPTFTGSIQKDYYVERFAPHIRESLAIYFEGGFLYNIDKAVKTWVSDGLISGGGNFNSYTAFQEELVKVVEAKTRKKIKLGAYYEGLDSFIFKNRTTKAEPKQSKESCAVILSRKL